MNNLQNLLIEYGKEKLNSLTKYPSILTLHELGDRGKLLDTLTLDIRGESYTATEKIDGTNSRILLAGDEYIIGSREELLTLKGDTFYNPSMDIVENLQNTAGLLSVTANLGDGLTVIYGELYGGKVGSNFKQYGKEKTGFRVFDVVHFTPELLEEVLILPIQQISLWREHLSSTSGYEYGQPFSTYLETKKFCETFGLEQVPTVAGLILDESADLSHEKVLEMLQKLVPSTQCGLSDTALGKAEGMVLKADNPRRMVKIRYEDYERTLRKRTV